MTICKRCGEDKDLTIGIKSFHALICNQCVEELIIESKIKKDYEEKNVDNQRI